MTYEIIYALVNNQEKGFIKMVGFDKKKNT